MAMNGVNGVAGASTGMLAPDAAAVTQPPYNNGNGTRAVVLAGERDISRFMPVMNIEQAIARREVIVQATSRLMTAGVDFGKIPGAGDRDVLLQPGADKLCNLFGLVIEYELTESEEDWTGVRHGGEPFFYYKVKGRAYRGEFLMGEGVGSCNSWESKYRWRKCERVCPGCGKENIRKSRNQGEGWYCWTKTGGCGATFKEGDKSIEGQEVGRKPNPDAADVVNTVLKMAYKRCKVATTINATSASEFFTQDVEDFAEADISTIQRDARFIATGGHRVGTQAAADYVAQQNLKAMSPADPLRPPSYIEDLSAWPATADTPWLKVKGVLYYADQDGNYQQYVAKPNGAPPAPAPDPKPAASADGAMKYWNTRGEMKRLFAALREKLGEVTYLSELERFGVKDAGSFRSSEKAVECYERLLVLAQKAVA